jgi:hypothetical protein
MRSVRHTNGEPLLPAPASTADSSEQSLKDDPARST